MKSSIDKINQFDSNINDNDPSVTINVSDMNELNSNFVNTKNKAEDDKLADRSDESMDSCESSDDLDDVTSGNYS